MTAVAVYLVQHGQAKPEDEDPERPLTDRGVEEVTGVAHWAIDSFGVRPQCIVHSGKTRARQTAEIWGRMLDIDVEERDGLAPNDDPGTWTARLAAETREVMLVGHLPHLAKLAGLLLTGDLNHPLIGFHEGGVVAIGATDEGWLVRLVLPPHDQSHHPIT